MCKFGLVIHSASCTVAIMSEVRHQESGAAACGYDFILDFVYMVLSVNSHGLETGILDAWRNPIFVGLSHTFVKPHGDEH